MVSLFQVTTDPDLKTDRILRRYLDLPKYLDLLRSKAIYLRRAGRFPDKFEGALTPAIRRAINQAHLNGDSKYDADGFYEKVKGGIYLNCWSYSAHDNMALWQLYGGASTGIVVTTTLGRLIQSALNWNENVLINRVRYIDHFKNPDMVIGSFTDPLRFKHLAYRFEQEVRIMVSRFQQDEELDAKPDGIRLPLDDLNNLIRSVVVAPEAEGWFFELVRDITKRYGVNAQVRSSKLTYLPK